MRIDEHFHIAAHGCRQSWTPRIATARTALERRLDLNLLANF
jgi:hypothetical protein